MFPRVSSTRGRPSSGTSKTSWTCMRSNVCLHCILLQTEQSKKIIKYSYNNLLNTFWTKHLVRSILPGLSACATDDDVAMHLMKYSEDLEKYLHFMVGQTQAEACVTDKGIQQYLKVLKKTYYTVYKNVF